ARARSAAHATSGLPPTSASIFPGRRVERMRAGITTLKAGVSTRGALRLLVGPKLARLVLEHHGDVVLHGEGEPVALAHELERVLAPDERSLAQRTDEDFKQLGIHRRSCGRWRRGRGGSPRALAG